MRLTRAEVRRYLSHLHFEQPAAAGTVPAVLEQVARRGCIQYDPLDVVGRNADLTLQSRILGYRPEHLSKAVLLGRAAARRRGRLALGPDEDRPRRAGEFVASRRSDPAPPQRRPALL